MIGDFYEGSDLKLEINLTGMGFNQDEDAYTIDIYNDRDCLHFTSEQDIKKEDGRYYLPIPYDQIHSGSLTVVITAFVDDEDFEGGKRREVLRPVNIGPIRKIGR